MMTPGERKRIAERVRDKYRRQRREPLLVVEEVDEVPLEMLFDAGLTGIDRNFLEELGVEL